MMRRTYHERANALFRDTRLAYYLLNGYHAVCENYRDFYLKRFHDSGDVMTNEYAKAKSFEQIADTISQWLERNKAYKTEECDVETLDQEYKRLPSIRLKDRSLDG